jgi:hypothetical protein
MLSFVAGVSDGPSWAVSVYLHHCGIDDTAHRDDLAAIG